MLSITISVISFIGFCSLGYYAYDNRSKAIDCKIKYNSTKDFAENAAKKILELEAVKSEMAAKLIEKDRIITKYQAGEEEVKKAMKSIASNPPRNKSTN